MAWLSVPTYGNSNSLSKVALTGIKIPGISRLTDTQIKVTRVFIWAKAIMQGLTKHSPSPWESQTLLIETKALVQLLTMCNTLQQGIHGNFHLSHQLGCRPHRSSWISALPFPESPLLWIINLFTPFWCMCGRITINIWTCFRWGVDPALAWQPQNMYIHGWVLSLFTSAGKPSRNWMLIVYDFYSTQWCKLSIYFFAKSK